MRKALLLGLLLLFGCSAVLGFSLKEWRQSAYDQVKAEAEKSFSAMMGRPVTIESAGGILIGEIELRGVNFPGFGRVEKVILYYNPLKYAYTKGDIISALATIKLINGRFSVVRDAKGEINLLTLFSGPQQKEASPPPFVGRLVLENCRVNYLDKKGLTGATTAFNTELTGIYGKVTLKKSGAISFSVAGRSPAAVKINGKVNSTTGQSTINISAQELPLAGWGNYFFKPANFDILGGQTDLIFQIASAKTKGGPLAWTGKLAIKNGAIRYQNYELNNLDGDLFLANNSLSFVNMAGQLFTTPFTLNGRCHDFSKLWLDLTIALNDAELSGLARAVPPLNNSGLSGRGTAQISLSGTAANPNLKGSILVKNGTIYQQKLSGRATFSFLQGDLKVDSENAEFLGGGASANLLVKSLLRAPDLSLAVKFNRLNLNHLAQKAPGLEGLATGYLNLAGPINNMSGKVSAGLTSSTLFGQPIEKAEASFMVKNGDFEFDKLNVSSGNTFIASHGSIDKYLNFNLFAEAAGIKLSGQGAFGAMRARLDKFSGHVRWQLSPQFFAYPLRNIFASGEAVLSDGQVGDQLFASAHGKIVLENGALSVLDTYVKQGATTFEVSGEAGVGRLTDLTISCKKIDLADLKILNYFLPEDFRPVSGSASVEVRLTGLLPETTNITSVDTLLGLNANGNLRLNNCSAGDLRLYNGAVNFSWQERKLTLNDCRIVMPNTAFKLDLERWSEGSLAVTAEGVVDLSNFQSLTVKFGRINGQTGFALRYNSSPDNYDLTASFWANKLNLNNLYFDNITGSLNYRDGQLTCLEPISFRHKKDLYSLSGSAFLPPDNLAHSSLDLDLEIVQSDLAAAFRLFRDLQGEASRRLALAGGSPVIKLDPADLALPASRAAAVKDSTLYYSSATDKYFLKSWQKVRAEFEKESTVASEEALGGSLSGKIQLKGPINQLTGRLDASIDSGTFRTFAFDNLQTSLTLKNSALKITKAVLTKGAGNLTTRGDYNFNGNVALQFVADNMPLDVLTVIFPKKEFKGAFNMKAELDGSTNDLRLTLSAACKNITLAGIDFDEAFIAAAKKGDAVFLHKVSLRQGPRLSSLHGSWQLGRPGRISLEANLQGDSVGLMNLFSDDIRWIKGDSSISAKVSGTLDQPKIQGRAQVSNGTIYVKAIDSELRNLQGSAEVANNVIQLDRLTGTWYGQRTNYWPNPIGLAGTIDIDKLLASKGRISLNLAFSPTHLYLALPNQYTGSLHVNELKLQGPLNLDFSQGPTLSGQLAIDNTVLALPRGGAASGQTFPLELNLEATLGKNTYVTMGDVFSTDLSNIMMNLEVASNDFKIMGSLRSPSLLGKVSIKRGTVNIFNREFTLLSVDAQKKYFPYDTEKIKDNSAVFAGGNGPEAAVPDLTITSAVNVETQEKDVSGKYVKKPVNVLARLSGNPSAREERSSLKIALLGFTEDKTKSPAELAPTAYSEQELKVMLLPDFIKSLAGIGQEGEKTQVDTNAVVADYLSSRVQTILFRGLERELEQKLGLESLTLEYNLGPKVKEAMGVRDVKGFTETKPTWSVGFVKGFFDRLYVDMRYSEGVSQTSSGSGANSNFNYQLTYKLTPIWAIIYYREPMTLSDFAAGYQKVTLKAGFSFW